MNTCRPCRSPYLREVDEALVNGETLQSVADRHGLQLTGVFRHKRAHLARKLARAMEAVADRAARKEAAADARRAKEPPTEAEDLSMRPFAEMLTRREFTDGTDLLTRLLELTRETREIFLESRTTNRPDIALKALARMENQLELEGRILGELRDREVNVLNIAVDPETAANMARVFLSRRALPPAPE